MSFPALRDNHGAFSVESLLNITSSCAIFDTQQGASSVIKGKYECSQVKAAGVSSTTITIPTAGIANSTSKTPNPSSPGGESTGLSTGAKAGIGIGISLGFLGIGVVVLFLCLGRRRKGHAVVGLVKGGDFLPELSAQEKTRFEVDSRPIYEANGGQNVGQPAELPTKRSLDGYRRG